MKLTINREQLLKGLNTVTRSINDKHALPVLRNIKLTLDVKGLNLVGTNNELTISTTIPYKIGEHDVIRNYREGSILVSSKLLSEIVRRVEGESITIEVIDGTIVQVADGRSDFRLNSMRAEEYPELDLDPSGVSITLDGRTLGEIVDQTAFAASQKEQRPILTAVNLEVNEKKLTAIATDSARMAKKEVEIKEDVRFVANVPAKVLTEIARLVDDEKEVVVSVSDKKILFSFNGTLINSRLLSGEYPSTKNIIPRSYNFFLEANADELLRAMERVALLSSNEKENVVKLTMSEEDGIQVSTKSAQTGSAVESLSICSFNGERLEISFNATFVSAAVRACKSQDVLIGFLGEMKPFSVRNIADESHIQIITPLRTY